MKAIPLTDEELAEKQKAFDSMNELVYTKIEVKKCADSCAGRKSTSIKGGRLK